MNARKKPSIEREDFLSEYKDMVEEMEDSGDRNHIIPYHEFIKLKRKENR